MRIALAILIGIHGLIHLFGFLKAFGIAQFEAISQPVSKTVGSFWLMAFVLFLATFILFIVRYDFWWVLGIAAVIVSQFLILAHWKDAKFGSIPNLLILVSAIVAYSTINFQNKIEAETRMMLSRMVSQKEQTLTPQLITDLPAPVQRWLKSSGVVGQRMIQKVYLEQDLLMSLQPGQEEWTPAKARQYFTIDPPAFNWSVDLKMKGILDVAGRDKFENGKGEMLIKLFSFFPVVDAKNSDKTDQAALQRYLAEIVWFPTAALSPYITWEPINEKSARATLDCNGTLGSGTFYFDEGGKFEKFVTWRFKGLDDIEPSEWIVRAVKTEVMNGVKMPVVSQVQWKSEDDVWTWLEVKITHVEYNFK